MNLRRVNWPNALFLIITPIVAFCGVVKLGVQGQLYWQTFLFMFVFLVISSLSITAGYHRLFSHKSYEAHPIVRWCFIFFGASNFEGSVLEWCTDHRVHHLYTDTPKDPYNFKQGFWYSHIGWLFTLDESKRDFSNVSDLAESRAIRFQDKYFFMLAPLMGFVFPAAIASLWGDFWGGLIIAGALRVTIVQHMTFCINSVCHAFGSQPYSDRNSARDNWFTALFTFGEGYHNFHHKFPIDFRNGVRFYHFDPTKWLIRGLSFVGLASSLKRVSDEKIIQYRLAMDKKRLAHLAIDKQSEGTNNVAALHTLHESIMNLLSQRASLESAYAAFKNKKDQTAAQYRAMKKKHHEEIKLVTFKLKHALRMWTRMVKSLLIPVELQEV